MEELEPEQLPMDQVLDEIRTMLMSDMSAPESDKKAPLMETESIPVVAEPVFAPPKKAEADYFLLTPAMRCDLPSDSELSETVQRRAQQVLNKLQKGTETEQLSPALTQWLEKHLPELVEQALTKKMSESKN